ncbi:outer membrane porin, OprD family [Desulfuromusa kysingii]|uniref:Outer membrane porin, OprD family n=1 Tax=Desulfuromusa kysingii TaxID=37625 RepID=A0A1H4A2Q8_9BACT|nr:OprD family outer membrane porin [Desulfuromusa kysingii]SEA30319.1 outer membrane porin, OprD family [Desulfuromusa kysingii]
MNRLMRTIVTLLAIATMATPSFAETLQDALKAGTLSGTLSFFTIQAEDADSAALNGIRGRSTSQVATRFNYKSGSFYGFTLGTAFQASHSLEDFKGFEESTPGEENDPRAGISDARLLELYLDYGFKKSNLKVGRQIIHSPMVSNADSYCYPMSDSFDAAVITTTLIPDTMVQGILIKQWNLRNADLETHLSDPLYSLFVVNNSIENLTLLGQYATTSQDEYNNGAAGYFNDFLEPTLNREGWEQYLLQATYNLPISHPVTLGAQYGATSFDEAGEDDTYWYGAKISTEIEKIKLAASYVKIDEDNSLVSTFGHAPNGITYNNMWGLDLLFAGLESVVLSANYDFGNVGVKGLDATLLYATIKQDKDSNVFYNGYEAYLDGVNEIDLLVQYAFQGALEGLSVNFWGGLIMDVPNYSSDLSTLDGEEDHTHFRFRVQYAF